MWYKDDLPQQVPGLTAFRLTFLTRSVLHSDMHLCLCVNVDVLSTSCAVCSLQSAPRCVQHGARSLAWVTLYRCRRRHEPSPSTLAFMAKMSFDLCLQKTPIHSPSMPPQATGGTSYQQHQAVTPDSAQSQTRPGALSPQRDAAAVDAIPKWLADPRIDCQSVTDARCVCKLRNARCGGVLMRDVHIHVL